MTARGPQELHARALALGLRRPPLEEWDTFPFEGEIRPRPLAPFAAEEPPRSGEEPSDCRRCAVGDEDALWSGERWRVRPLPEPSGLPVVVLLEPRPTTTSRTSRTSSPRSSAR